MSDKILNKFISGKRLTTEEIILLDSLLNNKLNKQEIICWLDENWEESHPEEVKLKFEELHKKIRNPSYIPKINRLFMIITKAAAILFLPIFAAAIYLYFDQINSDYLTLSTQKGEQTSVILPDGSKVWLNVNTKLSYPLNFGVNNRDLKLEGEAYFEVEKNEELSFEVISGDITTIATGTKFIVSAEPESSQIKSSLVEGSVEIKSNDVSQLIKPGQQLIYKKSNNHIEIQPFDANYELAWKNKQLIFLFTPFTNVISELEKWYDIEIDYDPTLFMEETLTVRFEKYETLEQVLRVMAKANGFNYSINDKQVIINKDNE